MVRFGLCPNAKRPIVRWGACLLAGEAGFEPANGGSKGRCLSHLATPQRACIIASLSVLDKRKLAFLATSAPLAAKNVRGTDAWPFLHSQTRQTRQTTRQPPSHTYRLSGGVRYNPAGAATQQSEACVQRIQAENGVVYYQFPQWANGVPLRHGVFTRLGGVSRPPWDTLNVGGTVGDAPAAVQENHRRIYAALGVDAAHVCTVWQVHGAETIYARQPRADRRWLARADGIITDQVGLALMMRFADCVPILFYDPTHKAIGLAHAGWRGTVLGAAESTLRAMQHTFGTRPPDVQAAIGPSIGPQRYQVGEEVVEAVQKAFGETDGLIRRAADGSAYLDLWAANRRALERAGVLQIALAGLCTASHTDEFYSHRAEKGRTGRFGVVMALEEE